MKKIVLIGCVALILYGCSTGVSQEQYESVSVEALEMSKEVKDLQYELQKTQEQYEKLSKDYENRKHSTDETKLTENKESAVEGQKAISPPFESERIKGRGRSDSGRNEPKYKGLEGYAVVGYSEEYTLSHSAKSLEMDWSVPIYEKDKQFYNEIGTIPHKTKIKVIDQSLEHEGYGAYSGYLYVSSEEDGSEFYIDVENFVNEPYWEYNILEAAKIGYIVAEYNSQSDYYSVNMSNKKIELENGTKVLVIGKTGLAGRNGPNYNTHPLEACVFTTGPDGSTVYFNEKDLRILY